jgi:hypothetical protein
MIFIAHRGNLDGPNKDSENHPDQIKFVLDKYFQINVEIDLWVLDDKYYFGHDEPKYLVNEETMHDLTQMRRYRVWFHAKNQDALYHLRYTEFEESVRCNYFWHQNDDYTITSPHSYIWTYPGKRLLYKSICVLPESNIYDTRKNTVCFGASGICTDYIFRYYKLVTKRDLL